jgi:hypothetical protein
MISWRGLLLGYLFLALYRSAALQVPNMNALALGACVLGLSLPMMVALWHQGTVRRLVALHQFQPGRMLHRWGNRRSLGIVLRAVIALATAGAALLQGALFDTPGWLLLALAPLLYALLRAAVESVSTQQFSRRVYAERWSLWATESLVILLLVIAWIAMRYAMATPPEQPYADRIYALQSAWAHAPSGIVRWTLDAGAWGQASLEALDHLNDEATWRLLVALVVAPLCVFGFMALTLTGLCLPPSEIRRTFGTPLTEAEAPPPVGAVRAATWTALGTLAVLLLFQLVGALDGRLRAGDSPFAIEPLAGCEKIDGRYYRLNTSRLLTALVGEVQDHLGASQAAACQKLATIEARAASGVDAYLDWYFSLGAEWSRFATLLTGDVQLLLQARFEQLVLSHPDVLQMLNGVQADYEQQWREVVTTRSRALDLLEQNRIVPGERGCRVTSEVPVHRGLPRLDDFRTRLAAGSGAGLIAGAFAAKVTAKAMSKTAMKAASKVLAKATAKKAAGKVAATAAGAGIGSIVPGVGTAVGAVIGAATGLAIGTGIDLAMLAAEERLTRADMRRELLEAVTESLAPYRETFACGVDTHIGDNTTTAPAHHGAGL